MKHFPLAFLFVILSSPFLFGQEESSGGNVSGNVQIVFSSYADDESIGAVAPPEKAGFSAASNLIYTKGGFSAGIRYESYLNALQGFPGRFKGSGIGSRYLRYVDSSGKVDVTLGNYYDQFGSGIIFRSYVEPGLGIDNAMDGVRLILRPVGGLEIKFLYGKQRLDFDDGLINGAGIVRAVDGTLDINSILAEKGALDWKTKISLGANFLSKFQTGGTITQDTLLLELPENIGAWSYRIEAMRGKWTAGLEYAAKINDPSADNGYTYRRGEALLANLGYSKRGLGAILSAKMVDNMSFRSDRDLSLFDMPINFIPAITKQHTYNLAATLYPYATVIAGESSISADLLYTIPKGTFLGGAYGTNVSISFAGANGLDTTNLSGVDEVVYGYERNSWGFGSVKFVRDLNIQISRKESKYFKWKYTFLNLEFNALVTPVTTTAKGMIYADIHVLETQIKTGIRESLRTEFQILKTKQDKGDWLFAMAEYTWSPHWFVTVADGYNYGNPIASKREHYAYASIGRIEGAHRFVVTYGRMQEGLLCIGGVCRVVPASNGINFSFTTTF